MRFTRKHLTTGLWLASSYAVLSRAAGAAEFTYRLSDDTPADHPLHVYATRAADKIRDESNGRLDIRTFANSSLGGQQSVFTQARMGAIEFLLSADNFFSSTVPVTAITGIPFAFSGFNAAWSAMHGRLGAYIRNAIAKASINLYTFEESWDIGFKSMVNAVRPIATADDLKGLKMRTPPNAISLAMFKAFGASPTVVEGGEIYTALQTHLVDGLDSSLVGIETNKFYEVGKLYASMTFHIWTRSALHVNTDAWARLPKQLRDIAERNFNAAAVEQRNAVARGEATMEGTLRAQGVQFNHPNPAPFKNALRSAGSYAQWRDTFGPEAWGLLENAVGKLA